VQVKYKYFCTQLEPKLTNAPSQVYPVKHLAKYDQNYGAPQFHERFSRKKSSVAAFVKNEHCIDKLKYRKE